WLAHVPSGAVFLLLSAHWLVPFFGLRRDGYAGGAPGVFPTGLKYLFFDAFGDRSYRWQFDTTVILQAVGLLAAVGLAQWGRAWGDRRQWMIGLAGVLGIAYLGSYV